LVTSSPSNSFIVKLIRRLKTLVKYEYVSIEMSFHLKMQLVFDSFAN